MKLNLIYISASSALLASAANAASISKRDLEIQENQCDFVDSRFFITPAKVSGDTASSYCSSLGGRLADVNQQNSMDLSAIVSKCLGPDKSVRIQTWDTNSFGTNHLALTNGFQTAAGSVNVAAETEELYALCQMVDTEGIVELETADAAEVVPAEESENTLAAAGLEEKIQIPDMDLSLDHNIAGSLDSNVPGN
ncbi:hypothetical protein INT48_006544 [Thamnidium elegans]|uniref:Uncharacterized protein n=1 Tax=Thamnidium elegans TaxID=101142 RepID=A0A8H7SLB3_9FUNG|nr:hypothetical protein INT48_006544 [Thamnidium elegans]